jgi:hypothetical protein
MHLSVVCCIIRGEMSRRRKRRDDTRSGSVQQSSPSVAMSADAPSSNVSMGADRRMPVPPLMTEVFKEVFERAVDRAKNELASSGRIGPTVFFVYTNGMIKVGVLAFKDELHKGLLKKRIREKALAENASAVMILTEGEGERPGTIILSGAAPGMRASARVDYAFDRKTKTITLWETRWLDRPLQNAFLDGIFDTTS